MGVDVGVGVGVGLCVHVNGFVCLVWFELLRYELLHLGMVLITWNTHLPSCSSS